MARPPQTKITSRLNLVLVDSVRKQLEGLKDRTMSDSLAEVIRRAINLYDKLLTAEEAGAKVILRDADGVERWIMRF